MARNVKAKELYNYSSESSIVPRGYNKLVPLDELMLKVGSYIAENGNFEHKSSIKSMVYGISESHLSDSMRKSPKYSK